MGLFGHDLVFDAGQDAQFAFHRDIEIMGEIDHLAGERHVFLEGKMGSVNHDGGKPAFDTVLAKLEGTAVIEVQGDRDGLPQGFRHGDRPCGQMGQQGGMGVFAGTAGDLQNDRGFRFHTTRNDALELLHVVEIVGRYRKALVHGLAEHVARVHQAQVLVVNFSDHDRDSRSLEGCGEDEPAR